jgi:hypothetical protein
MNKTHNNICNFFSFFLLFFQGLKQQLLNRSRFNKERRKKKGKGEKGLNAKHKERRENK